MNRYLLLFCFSFINYCLFAQLENSSLVIANEDSILEELDTVLKYTEDELREITINTLSPKLEYLSDETISAFIALRKEELPDLSDEIIKAKLANIPTTLNIRFTPDIGNQIRSYIYYQRNFLVKMLTKAEYFFPLFEEELDKNNLPLELKYVSIIESHLDPLARSPMGATGLWQFMYTTAKYKGMSITSLEDERRNPQTSTQFAIKYFEQLHNIYDDWLLAISSYNAGPGNINKAIRACGGYSNYWVARPYMPRETQLYIPKIIAVMFAMHYAEDYYLHPRKPALHYTDVKGVLVYDKLSFKYTSELLGLRIEDIQVLNPSLTKQIIPKRDTGYILKIPNYAIQNYENNKGFLYDDPYFKEEIVKLEEKVIADYGGGTGKYFTYSVTTGDNLGYIAEKFNCRVSDIKRWNGLRSNFLSIGKKLRIYGNKPSSKPTSTNNLVDNSNSNEKVGYTASEIQSEICSCYKHQIVSGDNLWDISIKYNTTVEAIKKENNIPLNWKLKLGVYLKILKT